MGAFLSRFLPICVTLLAFTALLHTACNEDKCATIQCAHRGVCHDGACTCATGYEGPLCEIFSRKKFLGSGSWTELDSTATGNVQYPIGVTVDTVVSNILITHFCNYFTSPVIANVSVNTLTIPLQLVDNKKVQGTGQFNNNSTVSIQCIVTDATGAVQSHYILWH